MPVINKKSIKDQLYLELKKRILNQKYAPGEKIVIDSLARELSVSNTPLREALAMLDSDGLVSTTPNSGIRVVNLDDGCLHDINQSVYALLSGAYELCQHLNCMDDLIYLMEERILVQQDLLNKKNEKKFIQAAITFDRSFLDATKNTRLINIYKLQADIFFLAVAGRNRNLKQREANINEHKAMLKAIKKGIASEVKIILASHYRQHKN